MSCALISKLFIHLSSNGITQLFALTKTKFFWVLLFLCASINICYSQVARLQWAAGIGGIEDDEATKVVTDRFGNAFLTGSFQGSNIDFDPSGGSYNLSSAGLTDIFLAKFSPVGQLLWAFGIGGPDEDQGFAIDVDSIGNVYIVGSFQGTNIDFDPGTGTTNLSSVGEEDAFIAKYDANGNFQWAHPMGGTYSDQAWGIALNDNGDILISGMYGSSNVDFNPGAGVDSLSFAGGWDIFISRFTSSGTFVWVKGISGSSGELILDLQMLGSNKLVLVGQFGSPDCDFDPGIGVVNLPYVWNSLPDIFIAAYDLNGSYLWAKGTGGAGVDHLRSLAIDHEKNILITGHINASSSGPVDFDFGPGVHNIDPFGIHETMFVSKYDSAMNHLWAIAIGGRNTAIAEGWSISVNQANEIFVTGQFRFTVDFDPGIDSFHLFVNGGRDIFLAKYNPDGIFEWAHSYGTWGEGQSVHIDHEDNIWLSGRFRGTTDFALGTDTFYIESLDEDIFICKYSEVPSNELTGKVFLDLDRDTVFNNHDFGFPYGTFSLQGSQLYVVNQWYNGSVHMEVDTGTMSTFFTPYDTTNRFNVIPDSLQFSFQNYGNHDTISFAVQLNPGHPDLHIKLYPLGNARPGREVIYEIFAKNEGTDTLDGAVTLYLDSHLTLINSLPAPVLYQGDSLFWPLVDFAPFEERVYEIELLVDPPPLVNIWDRLMSEATIRPIIGDEDTLDNISSLRQFARLGIDPNDKWVSHEILSNEQVLEAEFLTYRIRFQNTGNDTAFNVVVLDTLSTNLDWGSLQMIHASHPWVMSIKEERYIEWSFPNILLPDSNIDESGSHGLILFQIRPKNNLQLGDSIENSCSIYFDFNLPVKTNTAVTKVFYGAFVESSKQAYCQGDTIWMTLTHVGALDSNNQTHVLMSDAQGQFLDPDTLVVTPSDTNFFFVVPNNFQSSNSYFIQAHTTSPSTDGTLARFQLTIGEPIASISAIGDTYFCSGESVTFEASTGSGYQYQWFMDGGSVFGANGSFLWTTQGGIYNVVISNECGIDTSNLISLTEFPLPIVEFDTSITVCDNTSSFMMVGGVPDGGTYLGVGMSNNMFSPTTVGPGVYVISYIYTDKNGCSDTAWSEVTVELCNRILETDPSIHLRLIPNPANSLITLNFNHIQTASLEIWSSQGIKVFRHDNLKSGHTIDSSSWPDGIYIVELKTEHDQFSQKLIIQHH